MFRRASIGDFVWSDTDGDGIQDSGESGLGGVTVNLLSGTGTPLLSTTTASDGKYLFHNLLQGDYQVEFYPPAGYRFSPQDQGGDGTHDSDVSPASGRTGTITLLSGEENARPRCRLAGEHRDQLSGDGGQ